MQTSIALVRSSLEMLVRLQAEESILAASRAAVGNVSLAKTTRSDITSAWAKAAATELQPIRNPKPENLGALGIGVKRAKRAKRGH